MIGALRCARDWLADRLIEWMASPPDYLPLVDGAQPRDARGRFIPGYIEWRRPDGQRRWIHWPYVGADGHDTR